MYFDENNNFFDDYNETINNKEKHYSFDIDINNINFNRNNTLTTYNDGFNKGNMFKDLYSQYKNYVYKLKVNNNKDELLYKIQMYNFALKDLILYLDVYPNDQSIMQEYVKVKNYLDVEKDKYEKMYGPLCASNVINDKWTWINNPWPWDKGGK